MNIFVLDKDPTIAAQMQCDQHVVKMTLETAQLLCNAFEIETPYKKTHLKHPCSIWVRESFLNFIWLSVHGVALADEFERRFRKIHKSKAVILWCIDNSHECLSNPKSVLTEFAQAMPDEYKVAGDAVAAYHNYYNKDKSRFTRWSKNRKPPEWFIGVKT